MRKPFQLQREAPDYRLQSNYILAHQSVVKLLLTITHPASPSIR